MRVLRLVLAAGYGDGHALGQDSPCAPEEIMLTADGGRSRRFGSGVAIDCGDGSALFANPHFPRLGGDRMCRVRPPVPGASTARRFTLHKLKLVPVTVSTGPKIVVVERVCRPSVRGDLVSRSATYFVDASAVPHVTDGPPARCADTKALYPAELELEGSTSDCVWDGDPPERPPRTRPGLEQVRQRLRPGFTRGRDGVSDRGAVLWRDLWSRADKRLPTQYFGNVEGCYDITATADNGLLADGGRFGAVTMGSSFVMAVRTTASQTVLSCSGRWAVDRFDEAAIAAGPRLSMSVLYGRGA